MSTVNNKNTRTKPLTVDQTTLKKVIIFQERELFSLQDLKLFYIFSKSYFVIFWEMELLRFQEGTFRAQKLKKPL